jgi:hypothetical protein
MWVNEKEIAMKMSWKKEAAKRAQKQRRKTHTDKDYPRRANKKAESKSN